MAMLHRPIDVTRDYIREELAKPGGRVRFLLRNENGGFIVNDPEHHVADIREGWAGGVAEADAVVWLVPIGAEEAASSSSSSISSKSTWLWRTPADRRSELTTSRPGRDGSRTRT